MRSRPTCFCVFEVFFKRITLHFREIKRRGWACLVYLSSAAKKAELASPFWGVSVWTLACTLAFSPKSVWRSFLSNWSDSDWAIYHWANLLQVKHMHWTCDSLENSPVLILPLLCFHLLLTSIFLTLDYFLHPSSHLPKVESDLEGVFIKQPIWPLPIYHFNTQPHSVSSNAIFFLFLFFSLGFILFVLHFFVL